MKLTEAERKARDEKEDRLRDEKLRAQRSADHPEDKEISADREKLPDLELFYDDQSRLVCKPYSVSNLHSAAKICGIKRCWFDKTHYRIPKKTFSEMKEKATFLTVVDLDKLIKKQES